MSTHSRTRTNFRNWHNKAYINTRDMHNFILVDVAMKSIVPTLRTITSLLRPAAKSGSRFVTLQENELLSYAFDIVLDKNSQSYSENRIFLNAC